MDDSNGRQKNMKIRRNKRADGVKANLYFEKNLWKEFRRYCIALEISASELLSTLMVRKMTENSGE